MDLVGKMLAGRYDIIDEVGKGGMANVYKAQDHFLNRFVAIKVLKEELSDDKEFVHRFNTEAQAAARISNPHVVSIYDVGFENGLYYIVMEYIEGITLKEYIEKKHNLSWREAAEFAAQICEGLDAAHKQSVIHRDIKPQNIIMTADNVLKVTDFGIARATSQATTTNSSSTIGTVHYLSPEQARGGYTNEKTDIYSLGVVLYEMLTGRLPFNDSTAVAIAIKHIQEKPILPRILNNDIPESMEYIVMKAMNKEQGLRYASAEDFLTDLRKVIANPNVKLNVKPVMDADMEATRKRSAIGDDEIENYERNRRAESKEYKEYAEKMDREMEERRLRNIDRKQAIKAQKKKERRITIAAVLAAILVIAGLGFAFSALSGGSVTTLFTGAEKIDIPNVIDMKLTDAQKKYKSEGFSIVKKSERASDKEAGTILEQDPPAGNSVTKKSDIIINVVVSAGIQNKTVDNYVSMKSDDAKKKVEEGGFKVNIVEQESSSVEKGVVISQMPASGTSASEGALVTLYVSTGDAKNTTENNTSNDSNVSTPSGSNSNNSSNTNSTNSGSNSTGNNTTGGGSSQTNSGASNGGTSGGSSSGTNGGTSGGSSGSTSSGGTSGNTSGGTGGGLSPSN